MLLESIPPPEKRLRLGDTFCFSCRKDLACFNTCCGNKDLVLTPYDVLRLKNALTLHSDEFLTQHTLYRLDPVSGFPVVTLKMTDDPGRPCPFVGEQGCGVYQDRPTACRLYPLARATSGGASTTSREEFFFLLDTPKCLGIMESQTVSLETWLKDQGLHPYTEANNQMLDLVFRHHRDRCQPLEDRQLQKIFVACYNLDVFRDFVLKPGTPNIIEIDAETRQRISRDDTELLGLGFLYLRGGLF